MIDTKALNLALKAGKNSLLEGVYLKSGICLSKPTSFYAIINDYCNARCRMCSMWDRKKSIELPAEVWINHLNGIHNWVGRYFISFSGGEPLIKKDFLQVLEFCRSKGISAGITTNSIKIDRDLARELIALKVFNISISLDGANAETHDYLRGVPGLFDHILEVIEYLKEERDKQKQQVRIILKTVVNSRNLEEIPDIIRLTTRLGVTGIQLQPIFKWTEEAGDDLWIKDMPLLDRVIREVLELYKAGAPILVPEATIRNWKAHFTEDKLKQLRRCTVGLTNYRMQWDGMVSMCTIFPYIGDFTRSSAREIWNSEEANKIRRDISNCKRLCLTTCFSKKTIRDKMRLFMKLVKA